MDRSAGPSWRRRGGGYGQPRARVTGVIGSGQPAQPRPPPGSRQPPAQTLRSTKPPGRSSRGSRPSAPAKPRWTNPKTGTPIAAGGILPFTEDGLWVVAEPGSKGGIKYTDIGGKYVPEDCTIHSTIRRELYEETYGCFDLRVSEVEELAEKGVAIESVGAYYCLVVEVSQLPILPDPEEFDRRRRAVLDANPRELHHVFKQLELTFLDWAEIEGLQQAPGEERKLSYRLSAIVDSLRRQSPATIPRPSAYELEDQDELEVPSPGAEEDDEVVERSSDEPEEGDAPYPNGGSYSDPPPVARQTPVIHTHPLPPKRGKRRGKVPTRTKGTPSPLRPT